jgi:hypothetical protein
VGKQAIPRSNGDGAWRLAALIAVLALCLRLVWPAPPIPPAVIGADGVATFGEHALCLAGGGDLPASGKETPAAPADHADHDSARCCLFHAVSGVTPVPPAAAMRIAFVAPAPPSVEAVPYRAPAYPRGTSPARAPPVI